MSHIYVREACDNARKPPRPKRYEEVIGRTMWWVTPYTVHVSTKSLQVDPPSAYALTYLIDYTIIPKVQSVLQEPNESKSLTLDWHLYTVHRPVRQIIPRELNLKHLLSQMTVLGTHPQSLTALRMRLKRQLDGRP
jgi:hypothetical protein